MQRKLGSAILSQLAFPGEGDPNFQREKAQWHNTVIKKIIKYVWTQHAATVMFDKESVVPA